MGEHDRRPEIPAQAAGLPVLRRDSAFIDVGSAQHWVCGPALDATTTEVATFAATTPALHRLVEWLRARQVRQVGLESTGVYWIPVYDVLEAAGFDVLLTDARALRRAPGRQKTDKLDCEWGQRLLSCGLLTGAFRPPADVGLLRTLVRDRARLVSERSDWIRRMQKSLDEMNVRVHRAVADLEGATGMGILRAIVAGERDPQRLAALRDPRCRHSEAQIAEELTGHWRPDHLFSLTQALKMYDAITERLTEYDREIQRHLAQMTPPDRQGTPAPPVPKRQKAKAIAKRGEDPLRQALYRVNGVDLTTIDALGVETVSVVISEYGPDLSRFPTEKQFIAHVRLAPHRPTTGGKPIKGRRPPKGHQGRVAAALRMAALSVRRSKTALGAYYRRHAQRLGAEVAVFATARRLAQLIYRLLRWGQPYVDIGAAAYEQQYQERRVRGLARTAHQLGYELVALEA
jgi:transposase